MKSREKLRKEVTQKAISIKESFEKIRKEEYTPVPETIKNQVFAHLIKAKTELEKKEFCKKIEKSDKNYSNNLPKDYDMISIVPSIRAAISTCKNHYSFQFKQDVLELIDYIAKNSDERDLITNLKAPLGRIYYYIQDNKEYHKVEELIEIVQIVGNSSEYNFNARLELFGLLEVLIELENSLNVIHDIQDKNLKNAVIDYFDINMELDKFIFEK